MDLKGRITVVVYSVRKCVDNSQNGDYIDK